MTTSGPVAVPVVQIHLTRHCNLQCRHCYTASGPRESEALDSETIRRFLADAWSEGYRVVSFSGGEPLIHPEFFECVETARTLGYGVNLTTNGMLITAQNAARIASEIDSTAVSIDGPADLHNKMRKSLSAYAGAVRGLKRLRNASAAFAIIHTVTHESLHHLRWLYQFTGDAGANSLQLHLLEGVGRAMEEMTSEIPGEDLAVRVGLLAKILSLNSCGGPEIQADILPTAIIREHPEFIFAGRAEAIPTAPLSELVNPLILETDGTVLPVTAGISREFKICNLAQQSLKQSIPEYRRTTYSRFRQLCRKLYDESVSGCRLPYVDWYAALSNASQVFTDGVAAGRIGATRQTP